MICEIKAKTDFSGIRYAQCWEDADVLLAGLDIQPGDACLSIASAGDNVLAMFSRARAGHGARPEPVRRSPAWTLRVAAFRALEHGELLELIGSTPSHRRMALYRALPGRFSPTEARAFWDASPSRGRATASGGRASSNVTSASFRTMCAAPGPFAFPGGTPVLRGCDRRAPAGSSTMPSGTTAAGAGCPGFSSRRTVIGRLGRDPRFFRLCRGQHLRAPAAARRATL